MTNCSPYETLDLALKQAESQLQPSEVHGIQVGMICGSPKGEQSQEWLSVLIEALDCRSSSNMLVKILTRMRAEILTQFHGMHFDFNLVLPDEAELLTERVFALGEWCRGFLCGLGLAGITEAGLAQSKVVKEIVHDLSRIAYVDAIEVETDEDDEEDAFIELVEYVRIAVQNIQIELKIFDHSVAVWH